MCDKHERKVAYVRRRSELKSKFWCHNFKFKMADAEEVFRWQLVFCCVYAYAWVISVYTYDVTMQAQAQAQKNGNRSILLCLCLCLRRCIVRLKQDDASINTSVNTRHLCLRRTGLHVGFLCLCLCLCLRRMCKPELLWVKLNFCIQTVRKKQAKDKQNEEPEWFTFGPSSQFETMELKGFDDMEEAKNGITILHTTYNNKILLKWNEISVPVNQGKCVCCW